MSRNPTGAANIPASIAQQPAGAPGATTVTSNTSAAAAGSSQPVPPPSRASAALQSVAASRELADDILASLREFETRSKTLFDRIGNALSEPYPHEESKRDIDNLLAYLDSIESLIQKNGLQYLSYVRVEPGEPITTDTPATALPSLQLADKCRQSINAMDRNIKQIIANAQTCRNSLKSMPLLNPVAAAAASAGSISSSGMTSSVSSSSSASAASASSSSSSSAARSAASN